jgi:RsiW-degrading membrane proteinase PrsW (M82 family)
MIELIKILISLFPVFIFLAILIILDSFKLVRLRMVLLALFYGSLVAIISSVLHNFLFNQFDISPVLFARYVAPFSEEILKACFIIYLVSTDKIGFMVDGAILGFAIGTGFSFIENIYYLNALESSNILLWIIRGFGTAVMHGGTVALFAIITKSLTDRHPAKGWFLFAPGLLAAIIFHSFFNHFILPPVFMTLLQLVLLPLIIIIIYLQSERLLREWLEIGFDVDVWLLEQIITGHLSETKIGNYLDSLKNTFPGMVMADLLCYLRIHLELAIRAKGMLLLKEAGLPMELDPETKEKLTEMKFLEKSIGKTGKMALAPILQSSRQELWQIYVLSGQ